MSMFYFNTSSKYNRCIYAKVLTLVGEFMDRKDDGAQAMRNGRGEYQSPKITN